MKGSVPASANVKNRVSALREHAHLHQYTILLASELALILLYPFFGALASRDELFRLFGLIIFSAAFYAVLGRERVTLIALALGVPAFAIRAINILWHTSAFQIADLVLGLVFLAFVTTVLVTRIVSNPSVTTDTLAGAVSAYLLVGISFGLVYLLIEQTVPGSFRDTIEPGKHFIPSEFTFFSFVTLTTTGYGDIVPWGAHARSVAIIETVIGIIYPAVLIGRLVSLHGRKSEEP